LTLQVTIDSALEEVFNLDVGLKPREAANSDGLQTLDSDPSLAAEFDSDHVEWCKMAVVVATGEMVIAVT
jgi:hypothetical protein